MVDRVCCSIEAHLTWLQRVQLLSGGRVPQAAIPRRQASTGRVAHLVNSHGRVRSLEALEGLMAALVWQLNVRRLDSRQHTREALAIPSNSLVCLPERHLLVWTKLTWTAKYVV